MLGLPVQPGERNVLVLLMDRPQQAMAALARLFTEADREMLDDAAGGSGAGRRRRTSPATPGMLAAPVRRWPTRTPCVVDSLKDAALKLSDDETGCGWNRARQLAIEAGTELVELHHPRKGQDGQPQAVQAGRPVRQPVDPAGAGSVISLWGQAGDPIVELTHLKPVVGHGRPVAGEHRGPTAR